MKDSRREKLQRYIAEASVDDLQEISGMLNDRYRRMRVSARREALSTLKVGDEAELTHIKPQYLIGTRVTITAISGTRFVCRFNPYDNPVDPRALRRFGDGSFRVPANCLRRVD